MSSWLQIVAVIIFALLLGEVLMRWLWFHPVAAAVVILVLLVFISNKGKGDNS